MNTLFLDIETVPTAQALHDAALIEDKPDDWLKKLSLSACTAEILCLGYAANGDEARTAGDTEISILTHFWSLAKRTQLFVGYNILDFDLKFIWQRSIINGFAPTRDIPFIRFRQSPVYDVMQEWSKWGRDNVGLDKLAIALGIESSKKEIDGSRLDGSRVFEFYQDGKLKEIYEYCQRDVETVRKIYHRLKGTEERLI